MEFPYLGLYIGVIIAYGANVLTGLGKFIETENKVKQSYRIAYKELFENQPTSIYSPQHTITTNTLFDNNKNLVFLASTKREILFQIIFALIMALGYLLSALISSILITDMENSQYRTIFTQVIPLCIITVQIILIIRGIYQRVILINVSASYKKYIEDPGGI